MSYDTDAREAGRRGQAAPLAAVVAGALVVGSAPIFIRWASAAGVGPIAVGFWRMTFALPFLAVWAGVERRLGTGARSSLPAATAAALLALAGLSFAGDLSCWHWAVNLTTVANATLFVNFAPVFVAAAAWVWLGERFNVLFVLGVAVALTGAGFLVGASLELGEKHLLGDGLAFIAAGFYAVYIVANKCLRRHMPVGSILLWVTVFCGPALLAVTLAKGERLTPAAAEGWLGLLGLAVVCHVLGQGLILYGLARLPAAFASVTLLLQPLSAAALSWLILGETLRPGAAFGGVLVLAGILLARSGSSGTARREAEQETTGRRGSAFRPT
jgi:drug/metabolite transporter (DMT)-like permease